MHKKVVSDFCYHISTFCDVKKLNKFEHAEENVLMNANRFCV